jgi:hypothetical protein
VPRQKKPLAYYLAQVEIVVVVDGQCLVALFFWHIVKWHSADVDNGMELLLEGKLDIHLVRLQTATAFPVQCRA